MEDSGFLGRNLQDRRKWNDIFKVLSERKILLTKNTLSGKVLLQKWRDKDYRLSPPLKKTKPESICHHQTFLRRNAKEFYKLK